MILAHPIVGVILGSYFGYFWYWVAGSVVPDVDHLYVMARNKIFTSEKIIDSIRFEEKYNLKYKTRFIHSLLGAVVVSLPVFIFNYKGGLCFFAGYAIHLLLDWLDIDEKYYLFPFQKKFSGFLPIFSVTEIIFTIVLFLVMLESF